ncbi:FIG092679: Fe-S oxidoreductase, partial [hydrothermal vent metagenome]
MSNLTGNKFVRILESVRKPSTYLGVEPNSVHKNYDEIKGSMALVFPDLYEIGMSHLGLKILYNIINQEPDLAAERAFAPGEDFAEALLRENAPLMSLETKRPLADFDIVGFTIPYELSYTTILWILKLAGIPLKSAERDKNFPFVIGGGAGVYNPEPIADFFDFFILGDGEEIVTKVLSEVVKDKREPRSDTLKRLSKIPGVYVPSFFDVSYDPAGKIDSVTPILPPYDKAKRIFLPTLSESVFPVDMV